MLARFRTLLPYPVLLSSGEVFPPEEYEDGALRFKVHPPYQTEACVQPANGSRAATLDATNALNPAQSAIVDLRVRIDDKPVIECNALQIDVYGADFNRQSAQLGPGSCDPSSESLFSIANALIDRIRAVTRSCNLLPITPSHASWRLDYLTDDGESLPSDIGKRRAVIHDRIELGAPCLTAAQWQAAKGLSRSYKAKAWEVLLSDAEYHLPDVAPAIVFAAAGLEALIGHALSTLAPKDQPAASLWTFINDRGDFHKEPSVKEKFDVLLSALSGYTLKSENKLWEAFDHLRQARNSLVHEGVATVGKDHRLVTVDRAYELIALAKEVAKWIESILPEAVRRPVEVQARRRAAIPIKLNQNPDG
jgi:hypothetical protein